MTIYSLEVHLSQFGTSYCSMSGSTCCFLFCVQVFQEICNMVWYFHLYKNFLVSCDPHKDFNEVNEAKVDVFLELLCFLHDPKNVGI